MSKDIIVSQAAREAFKTGLNALADAVKVTLGPRGRNVAIERSWGSPMVTKDGATVAKEIELSSAIENLGAKLVREVTERTNDDVGDGTTTAAVLAQSLYTEGLKLVAAGLPAMDVKRGIDRATAAVLRSLQKQAKLPTTREETVRIGAISANGEQQVGELLADAFEKIGKDGVVTVEESQALETKIDIVEGMQFDRGYISPYFVTDKTRLRSELKQPYVLVVEKKISTMADLMPTLEAVRQAGSSLIVIAEDVDGEALGVLTVNKLRGVLEAVAVKAPGFGDRRKEMLKDIAALVGATPFMEDSGRKLDTATLSDLGRADSVIVEKDTTKIIGGKGDKAAIKARSEVIRRELETTKSSYDKEKLQERLARISGGVAVIKVGGATDVEVRGKKHRVEDAVAATRAALKDGYVTGGGVALIRARSAVDGISLQSDGERAGARLLQRVLSSPLHQIVANAGVEQPDVVINKVEAGKGAYGYDAQALKYCDLVEAGILDPLNVVRTALRNAASIVGLMLTTEVMIVEKVKPKKSAAGGGGGPGFGGGGGGGGGFPGSEPDMDDMDFD